LITYATFCEELVSQGVEKNLVQKLIDEYKTAKKQYFLENPENVILHSAKFADLVLAVIKNTVTKQSVDIDKLESRKLGEEIIKYPKNTAEDVILTLAIPRVADSIQTIRNKKDVAHVKTIDPDTTDSIYCVTGCDWMLSQLVLTLTREKDSDVTLLINSIMKKKVPLIEEFEDGSAVILKLGMKKQSEILLFLYHYYPSRKTNEQLIKLMKTKNNFYVYMNDLDDSRLIHRNNEGSTLTRLGIKKVEVEILPIIKP
jgi:hypothetical protein